MNYLRPELYKLIGLFEVRSRRWITGNRLGGNHYRGKGRGMEFRDVREYSTGDDIRLIDWNVTSRTGDLHVKEFYQERDIPVVIFLDLSHSIISQSSKVDTGFQLALFLILLHLKAGNRSQIMCYTDRWVFHSEPIRSQTELWKEAGKLESSIHSLQKDSPKTDHLLPLEYMQNRLLVRSLVYIISDFANYPLVKHHKSIGHRHEIHSFCLTEPFPQEVDSMISSFFSFAPSESNSLVGVYRDSWERDEERARLMFQKNFHRIDPNQDLMDALFRIMGGGA